LMGFLENVLKSENPISKNIANRPSVVAGLCYII
jgi:hypothetical protein